MDTIIYKYLQNLYQIFLNNEIQDEDHWEELDIHPIDSSDLENRNAELFVVALAPSVFICF